MSTNHLAAMPLSPHPDKTSNEATFELLVMGFAKYKPNNSALRCVDLIRDKLFGEGLVHGRREGYQQALLDMQQAQGNAGEFLQTLTLK